MTDARQAEQTLAQRNPNIQTGLVGGPTQGARMQAPLVQSSALPQAQQQAIQGFTGQLYGSGVVKGAESQHEAALREMHKADELLEQSYQGKSTLPVPSWYVPNPADEASYYGAAARGLSGVSQTSLSAASNVERSYQMATQNIVNKLLDFMQLQQSQKQFEQEREDREKRERMEFQMAIGQLTGQPFSITDPWTGEKTDITPKGPEPTEGERGQAQALESLRRDIQNWENFENLQRRYGNVLPSYQIREEYDKFQGQPGRWGRAKESETDLIKMLAGTDEYSTEGMTPYQKFQVRKYEEGKEEVIEKDEENLLSSLEGLRGLSDEEIKGYFDPRSVEGQRLKSTIDIMTQTLARIFEKGRMSDADREFYLKQTKPGPLDYLKPDRYRARVEGVIDSLKQKYGVEIGPEGMEAPGGDNDPLGIR